MSFSVVKMMDLRGEFKREDPVAGAYMAKKDTEKINYPVAPKKPSAAKKGKGKGKGKRSK